MVVRPWRGSSQERRRFSTETLAAIPDYPIPSGPQKQVLLDLQRTIRLYGISYGTRLPELIRHRESVRMTILDRCAKLLDGYGESEAA